MATTPDAKITVGDRLFGLRFINLVNSTGTAHTFTAPTLRMVNIADNTVKLAAGVCVSAVPGIVTYALAAIDVDTAGTYALQLTDTAGGLVFHWPVGREWILQIVAVV